MISQLPQDFLKRLDTIVPQEVMPSVLDGMSTIRPTTFRTNTLKIPTKDVLEELKKQNIDTQPVPWYEHAFILIDAPKKVLMETQLYTQGKIYIQSLSSMIPPLVLQAQPGELVCDLTAAPGSKTTQMAMDMKNTGEIIANDKSRIRLYKLEANIKMQGVTNTHVTHLAGQLLWRKYPEYFDKVLVDVPCSMEGRFSTLNEKSYKDWSVGKVRSLSQMQRFLLRSGISAAKVGGIIVYSTCTLSPEENEEVIDWILKKEKDNVVVEDIGLSIPKASGGIEQFGNKTYSPAVKKCMRIFPSTTMEGFFVMRLRKVASTVPSLLDT